MREPGSDPALSVEGVSFAYGARPALRDVSFRAERGAFTALLGVNGAGKSTLVNLITRLFDAPSGRIAVCGHDVARAPTEALRRLGVVFQSRALDPNLSVRENLTYAGALHGMGRRLARGRAAEALEKVGLADRMGERVRALSGGQQRRVEIARALMHRPELLLCDEATAGLDIDSRAAIVEAAHALAAESGVGVLWATHLVDEIRPDDPVVVLHQGAMRATGTAREIAGGGDLAEAFLAMTRAAA
jgi:ABC-2 type transport system ATP-binding protein